MENILSLILDFCQESSPHWASIQTPPSSTQQDPPPSWNRVRHGCSYPPRRSPNPESRKDETFEVLEILKPSLNHPKTHEMREVIREVTVENVEGLSKQHETLHHKQARFRRRSLWHHDPIPIVHGHVIVQQDIFEMESANTPILAISANARTARKNRFQQNRASLPPATPIPSSSHSGSSLHENAKMLSQEWKRNKNPLSCDLRRCRHGGKKHCWANETNWCIHLEIWRNFGSNLPPEIQWVTNSNSVPELWPHWWKGNCNLDDQNPCKIHWPRESSSGLCRPTIQSVWVLACRHRCKELQWGPPDFTKHNRASTLETLIPLLRHVSSQFFTKSSWNFHGKIHPPCTVSQVFCHHEMIVMWKMSLTNPPVSKSPLNIIIQITMKYQYPWVIKHGKGKCSI